ncbi:MAG TPA: glycosyltransferase family 39 protein [Acidobacteriota bacterium]|nr:glycosyltransferase family 39 protein [Acidobacteriota bacterium]
MGRVFAFALAVGLLLLYLHDLDRYGYWEDEIYTARDIGLSSERDQEPSFRLSFSELTYRNDNHPPLYFWVLEKWVRLFGFSEVSGRGFSILFLALGIVVLMRFSRLWGSDQSSPLWILLIFGVSTSCFLMAREARMYSMAFFLVCLSLSLFVSLYYQAKEGRASLGGLSLWVLATTLGLYTHYYVLFFYAGQLVVAGLLLLRHRVWKRATALIFPALLFLPWVPQLLRQRERKYESGLWVLGPQDPGSYVETIVSEGTDAISRLVFGSTFESGILLAIVVVSLASYLILRWKKVTGPDPMGLLALLTGVPYLLLVANDLYHHTITLTRTKYLFFLIPPLLLGYLRMSLGNLAPVKFCLLMLFLGYNIEGLLRERLIQAHPDWRAIAEHVEKSAAQKPLVVADDDYFLCMRYYSDWRERNIMSEDWLSVYPEDFWYLVLYLTWNPDSKRRVAELESRFEEVERVEIDRFSMLIHYRVRTEGQSSD